MDYFEAKISQQVSEKPGRPKAFIRTFAAKPNPETAKNLGKIFGLIEIASDNPKIPKLIDLTINEIKDNYYGQIAPDKNFGRVFDLNDRFEGALKKANLLIASFLTSEKIALDLEKINIFTALVCGQELHFTVLGKISAILYYRLGPDNYRIINILDNAAAPPAPERLKLFSQIISGKIRPRDVFFACTGNILNHLSLEKIKNLLAQYPANESLAELKKILAEAAGEDYFCALLLEIKKSGNLERVLAGQAPSQTERFNYRQAANQDSIHELIKTERETARLLTPSILPEFKKIFGFLFTAGLSGLAKIKSQAAGRIFRQKNAIWPKIYPPDGPAQKIFLPQLTPAPKFSLPQIAAPKFSGLKINFSIFNKIKNGFIFTANLSGALIKKISGKISGRPFLQKIIFLFKLAAGRLLFKYRQLPKSSQKLLIAVIVLSVLFAQSLGWLGLKNYREKKIEDINQALFAAESQKNNAESSLIYRDENQARQLLIDAKNSLTGLKPALKSQQEKLAALNQGLEEQLQKLRHLAEFGPPARIANFQNLDSQAKIANLAVASGHVLYTQNHNNQTVYQADLETRAISAIDSPAANSGKFILGAATAGNQIIFFSEAMSAFLFDSSAETLKPIAVNISGGNKIIGLTFFKTWLYLLDASNGQIYRYTKTDEGFGSASNWLKDKEPGLAQAKSLAVDGSVYILFGDGRILKFENGKNVEFKLDVIDPPFIAPTRIKTDEASKYLYVLDPPARRLAVFDKNGRLVSQYISENFDDLKDFLVFENEKEIYFLNGSSILGVPGKHIK